MRWARRSGSQKGCLSIFFGLVWFHSLHPLPFLTYCVILPTALGGKGPHLRRLLVALPSSAEVFRGGHRSSGRTCYLSWSNKLRPERDTQATIMSPDSWDCLPVGAVWAPVLQRDVLLVMEQQTAARTWLPGFNHGSRSWDWLPVGAVWAPVLWRDVLLLIEQQMAARTRLPDYNHVSRLLE